MSSEVERKKRAVQIGPDVRHYKVPLLLTGATVLVVLDSARWHIVHHALGASSGLIVMLMVIIWAIFGIVRFLRRKNR